jgi:hypothetical protein
VFWVFNHPPLAKMMMPTIALPVETQSHALAAVSQFSGVSVYRCGTARSSYNRHTRENLNLLDVFRRE